MAGPDSSKGAANSFTGASPSDSRARIALRVGSARAEKTDERSAECMVILYPSVNNRQAKYRVVMPLVDGGTAAAVHDRLAADAGGVASRPRASPSRCSSSCAPPASGHRRQSCGTTQPPVTGSDPRLAIALRRHEASPPVTQPAALRPETGAAAAAAPHRNEQVQAGPDQDQQRSTEAPDHPGRHAQATGQRRRRLQQALHGRRQASKQRAHRRHDLRRHPGGHRSADEGPRHRTPRPSTRPHSIPPDTAMA